MEKKEISILDILHYLVKNKRFIIIITLIFSIFAVIYSLLVPQYWVSTAAILPKESSNNALALAGSDLMGLSSSLLGGSMQKQSIELVTIMTTRSFSEDVINNFDLINYFEIDEEDQYKRMDKALILLDENMRAISFSNESGVVYVSIESKDQFLSADIANYYCKKLEKINLTDRMTSGKEERIFLENRLADTKAEIDSLSDKILDFSSQNNILNLEEQTLQTLNQYSLLITRRIENEISIEMNKKFWDADSPLQEKLVAEKEVINDLIYRFESRNDINYAVTLDSIPDLYVKYNNLILQLEIKEKVYEFLYPMFEQAKLQEIKDLPTIEVIDKAVPAGIRSKPKRAQLCIMLFLAGFILSSFIVIVKEMTSAESKVELKKIVKGLFRS